MLATSTGADCSKPSADGTRRWIFLTSSDVIEVRVTSSYAAREQLVADCFHCFITPETAVVVYSSSTAIGSEEGSERFGVRE